MDERSIKAQTSGSQESGPGENSRYSSAQEKGTTDGAGDNAEVDALPKQALKHDEYADETGDDKRDSGISPSTGYVTPMNRPASTDDWSADLSSSKPEQAPAEASQVPKQDRTTSTASVQRAPTQVSKNPQPNYAASAARAALRMQSTQTTRSSVDSQNSASRTRTRNRTSSSSWGKERECRPLPSNPLAGIPRPAHGQALPMVKQRELEERQRTRDEALSLLEANGFREGTSHEAASMYGKQVLAQPQSRSKRSARPGPLESATSSYAMEQPQQARQSQAQAQPQPQPQQRNAPGTVESGVTSNATGQPRQDWQDFTAQSQQYSGPRITEASTGAPVTLSHAEDPSDRYAQGFNEPIEAVGKPSSASAVPHRESANKIEDPRLTELIKAAHQAVDNEQQLTRQAEEELYARETITEEARAYEDEARNIGLQELEALEEASREAARKESEVRQEVKRVSDELRAEADQAVRRLAEYEEQSTESIEQYAQAAREAYTNALIGREKLEEDIQAKEAITRSSLEAEKEVRETYRHSRELFEAAANNEEIAKANIENYTGSADVTAPSNSPGDGSAAIDNHDRTVPPVTKSETSPDTDYPATQPVEMAGEAVGPVQPQSDAAEFQRGDFETQDNITNPNQPSDRSSIGESTIEPGQKETKKKRNRLSNWFHRNKKDKESGGAVSGRHNTDDWSASKPDPAEEMLQKAAREAAARDMANLR